jgi:hypothetical protein
VSLIDRWRRRPVPGAVARAIERDERVLGVAECEDGRVLVATRLGLWVADDESVQRVPWHLISKARLAGRSLAVVVAHEVGSWGSGMIAVEDEPERSFTLVGRNTLTDVVHGRVRGSVAASRHLAWPGGGGWVALRRVAGSDGLVRQLRLDPGADPTAPGLTDAAAALADALAGGDPPPG